MSSSVTVRAPRLSRPVEEIHTQDGRSMLRTQDGVYVEMEPGDAAVVPLIDGTRDLPTLIRDAHAAAPETSPISVVSLLRRLERKGLVDDMVWGGITHVPDAPRIARPKHRTWLQRVLRVRVRLPGLGVVTALGRVLSASALSVLATATFVLVPLALAWAAVRGQLHGWLDPFSPSLPPATLLALLYASASLALSARGVARGVALRALGVPAPPVLLAISAGVVHLDVDDAARRTVTRLQRGLVARAGLAAIGGIALLAHGAEPWVGPAVERVVSSVALILVLVDLAPYARTDGWDLLGIYARVPRQARRSASYLLRRALRNVITRTPAGPLEGTYAAISSLWIVHVVLSIVVLTGFVLPSSLRLLERTWSHALRYGMSPTLVATLVLVVLVVLAAAGLLVGVAVATLALARQALVLHGTTPATSDVPLGEQEASALQDTLRAAPVLAGLDASLLTTVARTMRKQTFRANAVLRRQTEPETRLCLIVSGKAGVWIEEESGLSHDVATLGPGECFGQSALLQPVAARSTVIAREPLELLSLDGEAFRGAIATAEGGAERALELLRNAAFVRHHPLLEGLGSTRLFQLLGAATIEHHAAGADIVKQGDVGGGLYFVREGSCAVRVRDAQGTEREVSRLKAGDHFGELASLARGGGVRTATVRTLEPTAVLCVAQDVFSKVLLDDLDAASAIEELAVLRLRGLAGER